MHEERKVPRQLLQMETRKKMMNLLMLQLLILRLPIYARLQLVKWLSLVYQGNGLSWPYPESGAPTLKQQCIFVLKEVVIWSVCQQRILKGGDLHHIYRAGEG